MPDTPLMPWMRQPEESQKAYAAFLFYRDLGPGRTIEKSYRASLDLPPLIPGQDPPAAPGHFKGWARQWQWVARADAWDRHNDKLKEEVRLEAMRKAATVAEAEWAIRRDVIRTSEFSLSQELIKRAREMLAYPLARKILREGENGEQITIIEPARWNMGTAVDCIELAQKLARASAKMPFEIEAPPAVDNSSQMYESEGELEEVLPGGATPAMPADINTKPAITGAMGKADGGLVQPAIVRPPR